jgi:hypothetical protein
MNSEVEWMIERFVSGIDCSLDAANKIEVALDDSFPDDDYVQQTIEMLAMYRPGGGDFLFDTTTMTQRLIDTIKYLRSA